MLPRTLFYALVAINIVLAVLLALPFLGVVPAWSSASEPERVAKQLAPDLIRVLPARAEQSSVASVEAKSAAAESSVTESTVEQSAAAQESGAAAAVTEIEVDEPSCIAFKGLSDDSATNLLGLANKHGGVLKTKSATVTVNSFWVHIPPDGGREAAEKRVEVLQRNGVSDFFIVREGGSNQYAVSLGLYRAEELAKRRLESLQKLGIKTATITTRENTSQRVELRGSSIELDKFVAGLGRLNKDKPFQRDRCQE